MAMPQSLSFGALLRRYRRIAGLTQEALAEQAGISARAVSDLERGVRRAPYRETIIRLAEVFHLSAQERAAFEVAAGRLRLPLSRPLASPADGTPVAQNARLRPGATVLPLVGRIAELAHLDHHLAGDGPPLLLLTGEPGIGKTRLLRATAVQARARGMAVLEGRCHRSGVNEPYSPVLDALARYIAQTTRSQLRADLLGCSWLVRLLPELAETGLVPLPTWSLPPAQERRLMFAAVERFLENVAGPAGTLLVLDDVQWAGPDALDLIASLLQIAPKQPLRLVCSCRDTELHPQHPIAALVADLARDGLVVPLALGPLSATDAATLVAAALDGAHVDHEARIEQVARQAGGVPFYLISCAQALRVGVLQAEEYDAGTGEHRVPWDVAQTIRQRIGALPEAARDLLAGVAIAGGAVPGCILTQIVDRREAETVGAIESACQARLLVSPSEDTYQFAHDLIADVVAADLSARRRKVLHGRIAEVLERQPGESPVEQLAYHYGRAGDLTREIEYLERTADRAHALHAHAEAQRYYQEAIARLERLGHAANLARTRYKLAGVLLARGLLEQAVEQCERAAANYRTLGEQEACAEALARAAQAHSLRGEPSEALACLRQGLAVPASLTPLTLARLHTQLTYPLDRMDRTEEALSAAEQACELARSAGDHIVLRHAELRRGFVLGRLGRLPQAREVLESVLSLERDSDDDGNVLCSTLTQLSVTCMSLGDYEPSMRYAEQALQTAERLGNPTLALIARSNRGWAAYLQGEWERARADLEHAVALTEQMPSSWATPYPILNLGVLCLAQGHEEAAAEHIERGLALAKQKKDLQLERWLQQELAEADLLAGQPEKARARLEPLLGRSDPRCVSALPIDAVGMLPFLAWAVAQLGDEEGAEALVVRSLGDAEAAALRPAMVSALRVQSLLATRQGRTRAAQAALEQGLALARAMPSPYDEAKLLHASGVLHLSRGDTRQARARLHEALAICARLGERLYAAHAERMLAELPRV